MLPEQLDLIAGTRRAPAATLDGSLENPNTGEAIAPRMSSSSAAADEALAAADRAFRDGRWANDAALRADAHERLADALAARAEARAERGVDSADRSGVSGTPSFFVNGGRHHGAYDVATLAAAVRAARKRAAATELAGTTQQPGGGDV